MILRLKVNKMSRETSGFDLWFFVLWFEYELKIKLFRSIVPGPANLDLVNGMSEIPHT